MKLVDNWGAILKRSYSALALYAIVAVSVAAVVFSEVGPHLIPYDAPDWLASGLTALLGLLGIAGRVVVQSSVADSIAAFLKDTSGAIKAGKKTIGAGVLALAVGSIGTWEGLETKAYRDIVGVWTVCYGETLGVKPGDQYTPAECEAMLEPRVIQFWNDLDRCIADFDTAPVSVQAATTSWAYNVGVGAACRSTLAKRLRAKQYSQACDQLPRWNRAGGKIIQGLTNRRISERRLCFTSL